MATSPAAGSCFHTQPHPAAPERRGVEPGKARFIIDVVLAIHRRAVPRWLAEPDTTLAQVMAQAAAELREVGAPPAPTIR
ncbi:MULTISPECIES: hypothetical protein [unclassified Streptomyces]|uniref:hypothetical protein n=1 Tax=unclassified Streptomyces TaxID=2593676 RepID=UPI000B866469|nr:MULTISPECIES: hypothetical protein [unclassified Streptomyces]